MKKIRYLIIIFLTISICLLPTSILANSAEPPGLTVIVLNPPNDLSLSLQFPDEMKTTPILLNKEKKAWEQYYRFFNYMHNGTLDDAVLIVENNGNSFQCNLPKELFNTYNNLFTLDISTQTIISGQPAWRIPVLVAMRIILTLLIEGFIFLLFGFRKKRSWIIFIAINLVTQGALNALLTGPQISPYWIIGFILGEIIVLAVETVAFSRLVKELKKWRTILYVVIANVTSLILGGLLITYLPI